jgi:hypothetical protein
MAESFGLVNCARTTIVKAPSPQTTGTKIKIGTLTEQPAFPYLATIWPANASPTQANSEIVEVTGEVGGELTIVRKVEGPMGAREVEGGDQFAASFTKGNLERNYIRSTVGPMNANWKTISGCELATKSHIIVMASTAGLETGMQITGPGVTDGSVITSIINSTTVEVNIQEEQSGEFFGPKGETVEKSKIIKKTQTKFWLLGSGYRITAPHVPKTAYCVKVVKASSAGGEAEDGEVELSVETEGAFAPITGQLIVSKIVTKTLAFGGPNTDSSAGDSKWVEGQAPYQLSIIQPGTAGATWRRPLSRYVYPQERNDNLGIGPAWSTRGKIQPAGNGGSGAFGNLAIGGIGEIGHPVGSKGSGVAGGANPGAAMENIELSSSNIAIGELAMHKMTNPGIGGDSETGNNTVIGNGAMEYNNSSDNTALGCEAMRCRVEGGMNIAIGSKAQKFMGWGSTGGTGNISIGYNANRDSLTGSFLTVLGHEAGQRLEGQKSIAIGYQAMGGGGESPASGTFTLSCEVTSGSAKIKTATTEKIFVGYQVWTEGHEGAAANNSSEFLSDERWYFREGQPWYVSAVTSGTEFEIKTTGFEPYNATPKFTATQNLVFLPKICVSAESFGSIALGAFAMAEVSGNLMWGCTAIGERAGLQTSSKEAILIGREAGKEAAGEKFIAIGINAIERGKPGTGCIAIGTEALKQAGSGAHNIGIGKSALAQVGTGASNIAIGETALNVLGEEGVNNATLNVAIGKAALKSRASGNQNVAIGQNSGSAPTGGEKNIYLGSSAGPSASTSESNKLYIGNAQSATPLIFGEMANKSLQINAEEQGFFKHAVVKQPKTTKTVTGFTEVAGTTVKSESTFTGNKGATAYTIGDIILALKELGLMAE